MVLEVVLVVLEVVLQLLLLQLLLQLLLLQLRVLSNWDNHKGLPMLELWTARTRSREEPQMQH